MSSAASTPESSRTRGGQRSNALKNAEKFFKPYTWATEGNIDKELTDEQLTEVRVQRLTGQLEIAYPDPEDVKEQAQAQGGDSAGGEGVDGWILKAVPGSGKKYL